MEQKIADRQTAERLASVVRDAKAYLARVSQVVDAALGKLEGAPQGDEWRYGLREGAYHLLNALIKVEAGLAPLEKTSMSMAVEPQDMEAIRAAAEAGVLASRRLMGYAHAHGAVPPEAARVHDLTRALEKQIARIRWSRPAQ